MKALFLFAIVILMLISVGLYALIAGTYTQIFQGLPATIGVVADIVTIFGIASIALAFWDYNSRQKQQLVEMQQQDIEKKISAQEDKNHIVKALKSQLNVVAEWTSYDTGGYKKADEEQWVKDEAIVRGSPFHFVFDINASYIQNINLLPGVVRLGDDINEAIARLNQEITSFNSYLREIRLFKFSQDPIKNADLSLKLKTPGSHLTDEEKKFVNLLVHMYASLHFDRIGDETVPRLHYWHKKLKDELDKLEEEIVVRIKDLEREQDNLTNGKVN